jgi:two-component system, chemotaxis family, protein-glutamate methylesterase/glutaminase
MSARVVIGASSHAFGRGLADCLQRDDDLMVVGIFNDTAGVIRGTELERPDLVALELDLPKAGGEEATRLIMRDHHTTRVVMIVAHDERHSRRADAALAAGAIGVVPRSAVPLDAPDSATADALRHRFRRLASARLDGQASAARPATPPVIAPVQPPSVRAAHPPEVVGICVSTGGPAALASVLRHLPADFELPLLVVQHMGAGFTDGFVRWLDAEVPLEVRVACAGEPLQPGVRVAPDGAHLKLDGRRLKLDRTTVSGAHRPSGDVLLSSLARSAGAGAVAVVMTGMGRDGAAGLANVAAAGGRTIAQDEASSTIYGMPRAAAELGARKILSLDAIGPELLTLSRRVHS